MRVRLKLNRKWDYIGQSFCVSSKIYFFIKKSFEKNVQICIFYNIFWRKLFFKQIKLMFRLLGQLHWLQRLLLLIRKSSSGCCIDSFHFAFKCFLRFVAKLRLSIGLHCRLITIQHGLHIEFSSKVDVTNSFIWPQLAIPKNSVLIFEVELMRIERKDEF